MKVIEIAFSCYPVTDLKRAKQFYENTLGLKQTTIWGDDNQAWIEYDIGPSTLAITNYPSEWKPSPDGGGVLLSRSEGNRLPTLLGSWKQIAVAGLPASILLRS